MKDHEQLEKLRERLYERGRAQKAFQRHDLTDKPVEVARGWDVVPPQSQDQPMPAADATPAPAAEATVPTATPAPAPGTTAKHSATPPETTAPEPAPVSIETPMPVSRRKKFRQYILIGSIVLFIIAMVSASLVLIFGDNTISGENISIDVSGPFAIGGGEEVNIQIAVANQNAVPIESATLIVDYPFGTQSATDLGKEIFTERFPLDTINSGELLNIPVRAVVFGEENDEKEINVSIEYRVKGSNATFFREAEPLRFKISSSPVVLQVDSVKQISSGQEFEATLTVISNSPSALTDLLVTAEYPLGFDFTDSSPSPVSGQNVWSFSEIAPSARETITVRGLLSGEENAERTFDFKVGVPTEDNPFQLGSTFTSIQNSITIEQPFLSLDVTINRDTSETVAVNSGQVVNTNIRFANPLTDALFDTIIEAELDGSGLSETDVQVSTGFYDSNTNTITWDRNTFSDLEEILPGDAAELNFSIIPDEDVSRTPEISMTINVKSRRVFENQASEELNGTVNRFVRVSSEATLLSSAEHDNSIFTNRGPIPPAAERETTYTLALRASNSSNDLTGAVVTAKLPTYVEWFGVTSSGADITFDTRNREVTWTIGELQADSSQSASFQVGITPSLSQVGQAPVLLESQQFKATDKFTSSVVRTTGSVITTELPQEAGYDPGNGKVLENPLPEESRTLFDESGEVITEDE